MGQINPIRRRIRTQIEVLSALFTGPTGELDLEQIINALDAWLLGNPNALNTRAIAANEVKEWDRDRRPRVDGAQLSMFDPDALLPIGNNQRVWMKDATQNQFLLWWNIELGEYQQASAAFQRKGQYVTSRLQAWTSVTHTLIEVERSAFGWK